MIWKYNCIITVIEPRKNKMLALKFKIIENKLYAFNLYTPEETKKLVEIKKINGINVEDFIEKIKEDDLYDTLTLQKFGINIDNQLVLDLNIDNEIASYDVYDLNSPDQVFVKPFEVNSNIERDIAINFKDNPTDNRMLQFASTNFKALLIILKSISISKKDQETISEILETINCFNDTFAELDSNLDILLLSTQLLLIEEDLVHIPNYIIRMMKSWIKFDYGDGDINESNNSILTDNNIDYKKIIIMLRNCLAHSNYKVLEGGKIEFYNEGKNKMKLIIRKKDVKFLFYSLYNYYNFYDTFPIIYSNDILKDHVSLNSKGLIDYLANLEIYELSDSKIKIYDNSEKQIYMDDSFRWDLSCFMANIQTSGKNGITSSFERNLKKHFCENCKLNCSKLSREYIKYVLTNIYHMGENHFYKLGKTAQIEIINNLIKSKYNQKNELLRSVDELIDCKYDSNDSLKKHSSDYIKLKTKLELLIISTLNNVFLFCYNQNKTTMNASKIKFSTQIYKDYLNSKVDDFYDTSKNISDFRCIYDTLLKLSSTQKLNESDYKNGENEINKQLKKLEKIKFNIECVNNILIDQATEEDYELINKEILNRIRDCLAHGKIFVQCSDFKNICSSVIVIRDIHEGKIKFSSSTSFGELLMSINDEMFLHSILDNNQNFLNHSK